MNLQIILTEGILVHMKLSGVSVLVYEICSTKYEVFVRDTIREIWWEVTAGYSATISYQRRTVGQVR